jgi:hypothetical protein
MALSVALADLDAIDLPPTSVTTVDQAQLRAIASLYLAADLEAAGIVPAVETLAGLGHGGLSVDLGAATVLIEKFWRARRDRATAEERAAAFTRLFQAGGAFEEDMLILCEALYKLDESATNATYGGLAQQGRVRAAAERLVESLVAGAGGVTVFIAQDILQTLRDCIAILGHAGVRGAFGARDAWGAIAGINRMSNTRRPDPRPYLRRGKAGMTVLSWLADTAPHLSEQGTILVALDHPVIPAAVDWMQAELAIGEQAAPAASPVPAARSAAPASPWAALAG